MCERHASLRVCACARVRVRWEEAKRCRDCQQWQVSFQDTQAFFTGYTGLFCRVRRSLFRHMHTSVSISLRRVAKDVRPSSCIQSCSPDSHKHRVVQNVDDDEDNSKSQSLVLTLRKTFACAQVGPTILDIKKKIKHNTAKTKYPRPRRTGCGGKPDAPALLDTDLQTPRKKIQRTCTVRESHEAEAGCARS